MHVEREVVHMYMRYHATALGMQLNSTDAIDLLKITLWRSRPGHVHICRNYEFT